MFDINGGEFLVLALLAALLLGPDRLPELARGAGRLIRRGRDFATGATAQMKDEMGVDLDSVDWRRYDPRQYHPRRIVQNALSDAFDDDDDRGRSGSTSTAARRASGRDGTVSAAAAKRAEAARAAPPARASGTGASAGSSRAAGGPGSAARDRAATPGVVSPVRPSPPPTTWADAARRAGVDDDAT